MTHVVTWTPEAMLVPEICFLSERRRRILKVLLDWTCVGAVPDWPAAAFVLWNS